MHLTLVWAGTADKREYLISHAKRKIKYPHYLAFLLSLQEKNENFGKLYCKRYRRIKQLCFMLFPSIICQLPQRNQVELG